MAWLVFGAGAGLVVALVVAAPSKWRADDITTYLAAGERLNAGHDLYALLPGDRPLPLEPGLYDVPLLSPPTIGVVWRPLAMIGEVAIPVWWLAMTGLLVGAIAVMARDQPAWTGLGLLILCLSVTFQFIEGNINALVVVGAVAAWTSRRERLVGSVIAIGAAVKILPIVLLWWLVCQRRWTAVLSALVVGAGVGAVTIAFAGWRSFVEFTQVAPGPTVLSLTGLARNVVTIDEPVAHLLPYAAFLVGLALVAVLRRHAPAGFVVAILTMVWGTPAVSTHSLTLLLPAFGVIGEALNERVFVFFRRRTSESGGAPELRSGRLLGGDTSHARSSSGDE